MALSGEEAARPAAIFFDVDFTLIYPGPAFQGEGYARFSAAQVAQMEESLASSGERADKKLEVEWREKKRKTEGEAAESKAGKYRRLLRV